MSLQETLEERTQEQRALVNPCAAAPERGETLPVSIRSYDPLTVPNAQQLSNATSMQDDEETVVAPIGANIDIGHEMGGGFIVDELVPVPKSSQEMALLNYDQIPMMVDTQPAFDHDPEKEYDFGRFPTLADYLSSVDGQEKPNEMVLAITTNRFMDALLSGAYESMTPNLMTEIYSNLAFVRRDWCETDQRFLQVVPYVVFYKKVKGKIKIFVYQRGKGVGEERLAGDCSIGIGGHINPIDFFSVQAKFHKGTPINHLHHTETLLVEGFWTGVRNAVVRELTEEVEIREYNADQKTYLVVNPGTMIRLMAHKDKKTQEETLFHKSCFFLDTVSSVVEKVHLGMFMAFELCEGAEIAMREDCLHPVGFVDAEELWLDNDEKTLPSRLECWSRSIIDSLYETMEFQDRNQLHDRGSMFMRMSKLSAGEHLVDAETVAKIHPLNRWKIGTLSSIFDFNKRFYAMNAFVRA